MIHLRSIDIQFPEKALEGFPYDLPVIKGWKKLELNAPVTFLVGENGSGKSTMLETLAVATDRITVGSVSAGRDKTLADVQELSKYFRLSWSKRTRKGFFLRAEDFFGYVKQQAKTRVEMEQEIRNVDADYEGRSEYAKGLAKMPYAGQLHAMQRKYGDGLDNYSHGESFLTLFQARFVPGGLYLLDEPEAPLSPLRQLAFLSTLKEMVAQEAQFMIATHSPIIMAFPGAEILSFDQVPIKLVAYKDLEHVNLTRDFLNDPEQFLRHL
jgi:predicted ATPase